MNEQLNLVICKFKLILIEDFFLYIEQILMIIVVFRNIG